MVNKVLLHRTAHPSNNLLNGLGFAQMLQGNALRHQMVLLQQQDIYDYWRSKCRNGQFPSRADISPEDIKAQLPTISLIEPCYVNNTCRYKYRLAGTGFWKFYNEEITGTYIDDLPLGDRCDYWNRILSKIMTTRRPSAGVPRPGTPNGAHLAQFWPRLPLSENGKDINLILGFDKFVNLSEVTNLIAEPVKKFA